MAQAPYVLDNNHMADVSQQYSWMAFTKQPIHTTGAHIPMWRQRCFEVCATAACILQSSPRATRPVMAIEPFSFLGFIIRSHVAAVQIVGKCSATHL